MKKKNYRMKTAINIAQNLCNAVTDMFILLVHTMA